MIALVASALLVLYILLPDFIFNQLASQFVLLKKAQRTRVGDIAAGVVVAALPFCVTLLLSRFVWHVGHWPFPVSEPRWSKLADYRIVASGVYSEAFFTAHQSDFWAAMRHVCMHQARFLVWDYALLASEALLVGWLTASYGSFRRVRLFDALVGKWLFKRASQWHVLLTPFLFPKRNRPSVFVDVIVVDGHLYRGRVGDFFLTGNGDLAGLLIKEVRRFQYSKYEDDRKALAEGQKLQKDDYWRDIPSANFIIPNEKIVTLNVTYEFAGEQQAIMAQGVLESVGIEGAQVTFNPTDGSE